MILMAGILLAALVVLLGFFVVQGYRYNQATIVLKSEAQSKLRGILDNDSRLQQELVANLTATDWTTRECVDRWAQHRSELLSGAGAKWTSDDVEHRQSELLDQAVAAVKTRALRRATLGALVIVALTSFLLLAIYAWYSHDPSPASFDSANWQQTTDPQPTDVFGPLPQTHTEPETTP